MKQIIYIWAILTLSSCIESNSVQNTDDKRLANKNEVKQEFTEENKENDKENMLISFENATRYELTDTIFSDFNGDGILDKAFYKSENQLSGIIIQHGDTNEEIRIGFGTSFGHITTFDWIDYWGLVEDKETDETTFTDDGDVLGNQVVKLQNPSIVVGANELGGGLITFKNGEYIWIHQTC